MPVDYANTWFYKIVSKDTTTTDCYVGYSTCQSAAVKESHISKCKTQESPLYKFIRNHGGIENFDIVKLGAKPCVDKSEVLREQRKYFNQYNTTLNVIVPARSRSEYQHSSKVLEQSKKYRQANKALIDERGREYYKANKELILESNRARYKRTVELNNLKNT